MEQRLKQRKEVRRAVVSLGQLFVKSVRAASVRHEVDGTVVADLRVETPF